MAFNNEIAKQVLVNPTLVIKAGTSPLVKSSNAFAVIVGGNVVLKAAGDMPALTGTIPTAYTSSYVFYMDTAGTITAVKGNNVLTTVGLATSDFFPQDANGLSVKADGKVAIGAIIVVNATGSTFTGGTTALDTASLTVYYTSFPTVGF